MASFREIQACKTVEDVFGSLNVFLSYVERTSAVTRLISGPMPVCSEKDVLAWVRELKAAPSEGDKSSQFNAAIFAEVYGVMRAASRRIEAIGRDS